MSLQLRVAKHQLLDLKHISELGVDQLGEVLRSFNELERPLLRPQELLEKLAGLVEGEVRAEALARQLLSLQGLVRQTGLPVDEVFAGIANAISQQGDSIDLDAASWMAVEDVVKSLVQDPSVRLTSTAIELAYDYANLLRRTKILTDIRPLFNEAADEIEGAVVSHTFRLRYDSADGEHELSIALDESDIKALIGQCNRALAKAAAARRLITDKCDISVTLSGEPNDD